eukprot:c25284_g2_i1 orf=132-311(+)
MASWSLKKTFSAILHLIRGVKNCFLVESKQYTQKQLFQPKEKSSSLCGPKVVLPSLKIS